MEAIDHLVGVVVDHLGATVNSRTISGEPIKVGDVTLVVLSMLSLGMGAGGGEGEQDGTKGKGSPGAGSGEGAGGGAKVRPAAVIAFTAAGVQVLPVPDHPDLFDKVVERIPEVVDMVEKARKSVGA